MATESSNTAASTATRSATPAVRTEEQRKQAFRDRPQDLGGLQLKLDVTGRIPGYHLYWENDEDGKIETLFQQGFEFVTPDEVGQRLGIVADTDVSHRISRFVGKKADGSPLRAILMKLPEDEWAEREASRYAIADARDADIRAGKVQNPDGLRKLPGMGIGVDTQFRKDYS